MAGQHVLHFKLDRALRLTCLVIVTATLALIGIAVAIDVIGVLLTGESAAPDP